MLQRRARGSALYALLVTVFYLLLFIFLLGYTAWQIRKSEADEVSRQVDWELSELKDIYDRRKLQGLVYSVETRALRPGANLYLLIEPAGKAIAGNIGSLAPGVTQTTGWSETAYRPLNDVDGADGRALVRTEALSGGFRLIVGKDLKERRRLFASIAYAAQWLLVLVAIGLVGGFFLLRWVLNRRDADSVLR